MANALLVRAAVAQYNTSSEIRLDPVGLSVYASERGRPPPGRPLLVFFGDSRALMWGRPAFPRYTVINRGIGWQTTAQILARLDADVLDAHPDVVVLEAGVNDLKVIAQLPQHREKIVRDCEANLAQIVEACRRAGARVIVASIFELGDVAFWRRPFWSSSVAVAIREVNAYIAKLAGDGAKHLGALDAHLQAPEVFRPDQRLVGRIDV
ncbi:MAG: GDSL-type esterase/lipase family protein, partial [Polyangiaceae bacterium]|nr:GDSL-type esterase/lipase family protein [Polyangiaceae bacterium]